MDPDSFVLSFNSSQSNLADDFQFLSNDLGLSNVDPSHEIHSSRSRKILGKTKFESSTDNEFHHVVFLRKKLSFFEKPSVAVESKHERVHSQDEIALKDYLKILVKEKSFMDVVHL